jgi:hypothetical protein
MKKMLFLVAIAIGLGLTSCTDDGNNPVGNNPITSTSGLFGNDTTGVVHQNYEPCEPTETDGYM